MGLQWRWAAILVAVVSVWAVQGTEWVDEDEENVMYMREHGEVRGDYGTAGRKGRHTPGVGVKYMMVWDEASLQPREDGDDIESVACTANRDCYDFLLNFENIGQYYAQHYDNVWAPKCIGDNSTSEGRCSCVGGCQSYSRDSSGTPFFYCGDCGFVGSECQSHNCTHKYAECSNGYCECIDDGWFYEAHICYLPFFGRDMAIDMLITSAVLILLCIILACTWSRINRRINRGEDSIGLPWRRNSGRRESPPGDTPPTYDDVVDKLPSYQDAIKMTTQELGESGVDNPGFVLDGPPPPPSYDESLVMVVSEAAQEAEDSKEECNSEGGVEVTGQECECDMETTEHEIEDSKEGEASNEACMSQPITQPLQSALEGMRDTQPKHQHDP